MQNLPGCSAVLEKSLSIILGCVWSIGEPLICGRSPGLGGTGSFCASFPSLASASHAKSSTDVVNPPPGHQVWADSQLIVAMWTISPGQAHSDQRSKAPSCLSALPRPQRVQEQSCRRVIYSLYICVALGPPGIGSSFWGSQLPWLVTASPLC